ncbi:unnamed protein product [Cylindrotheca closterium]|uniref:CST complex subunit CTC1 n=1 Tax=Cylindrotheca closterium TaxID=2856 RepID=A0AAD2JKW7_9STRA|nr:unnamed protein product [Cylindrotheca closterium]
MNPAASIAPLQGRISHRLELDHECSNVGVRSEKTSSSNKIKRWKVCGFVFLPSERDGTFPEFLLSLPYGIRRLACEATISKQTVVLTRYTFIHSIDARQAGIMPLLEVHSGGMQVNEASDRCRNQQKTMNPPHPDAFTLRQFRRYEAVFAKEMKDKDKRKNETYDIAATVDAISPIISMHPTFPFAFVELYDAQYPEETAILLLKSHDDFIYSYGIAPGETIIMCNLRRKSWSAPNDFRRDKKRRFEFLGGRIPSLVFITTASSKIESPQSGSIPPIPATTVPLVSLEGEIAHVETTSNRKMQKAIHWVMISGDGCESPGVKLFLTCFPMDTALQLSLQAGARIRAINVHKLCDRGLVSSDSANFGACLRATVSIIRMSSESKCQKERGSKGRVPYLRSKSDSDPSPPRLQKQAKQWNMSGTGSIWYPVPFQLKRIETSYHEYIYQDHVDEWLHENFCRDATSQLPALPSAIDLVGSAQRSAHVLKGQTHRSAIRNPYAEFFDHGDERLGPNNLGERCSGCIMSRHDYLDNFETMFLGLGKIKSACVESFMKEFDVSLRGGNMLGLPVVWSGSIHIQAHDIISSSGHSCVAGQMCTGGRVVETRSDGSTPASISDSWCQIPVLMKKESNCAKGDFITLKIEKAVVSCLCLRSPKGLALSKNDNISKALSPVKTAFFNNEQLGGGCTVVRHHGYMIIVAVHLVSSESLNFDSTQKEIDQESSQNDGRRETIASLLSDPLLFSDCHAGDYTSGIVLRHRFAPKKINPMGYSQCCELNVCSLTEEIHLQNLYLNGLSHLQSIDVKVSVLCPDSIRDRFKEAFACISGGVTLAEDECALGASWWTLADSGRTCALTSGGYDELQPNAPKHMHNQLGIRLRIPLSAMQLGGRGYVRCSVHSTEVEADFAPTMGTVDTPSDVSSENLAGNEPLSGFHFLGCRRVYDGILQRRPPRRLIFGPDSLRSVGSLLYPPQVPTVEVSTLFSQLCLSLRGKDTNHIPLAPSLVRQISHASFLGVLFCQVQCVCSKCFKPLEATRIDKHKKRRKEESLEEQSFWHLPHPNRSLELDVWNNETNLDRPFPIPQPKIAKHIRDSPLKCPSGHSSVSFEVRWECSGIVDDGTGQAKLYAERDAALTLLGMDAFTIKNIEEGIWSIPSGTIQFQKSVPPPEFLRAKVMHSVIQNRRCKRKNPLSLLEPSFRAEYLLHHHCRSSPQPRRPLDYFVRCKPLSDQIPHLHHTMVESSVVTRSVNGSREYALAIQDVATYSLPPLKLVLVDCAIPSDEDAMPPLTHDGS